MRIIDTWPKATKKQLGRMGLISNRGEIALKTYIGNFIAALKLKRCNERYVHQLENLLKKVCSDCKFETVSDLDAEQFVEYINDADMAVKTKRHHIAGLKQFAAWLYANGNIDRNNFALIPMPKVLESDQVHARRALTADELARLIDTVKDGKPYRNTSGQERALVYRLAAESGLRYNEIRTLRTSDFNFNKAEVSIRQENEKTRRGAIVLLKYSTAALLKDFLSHKTPQAEAFTIEFGEGAVMLRPDLDAAGIKYEVNGLYADFHSLRHSTASILNGLGIDRSLIQHHMRHGNRGYVSPMTKIYTHGQPGGLREAIERLPDWDKIAAESQKSVKTGTADGQVSNFCPNSAQSMGKNEAKSYNSIVPAGILKQPISDINSGKSLFFTSKCGYNDSGVKMPGTGLEPV